MHHTTFSYHFEVVKSLGEDCRVFIYMYISVIDMLFPYILLFRNINLGLQKTGLIVPQDISLDIALAINQFLSSLDLHLI